MTNEKILAFLNIDIDQPIDKTLEKILFWFDFSFTFFIIVGGLLTKVLQEMDFSTVFILGFIISNILFAIWIKFSNNHEQIYLYATVVPIISSTKLMYGSWVFSKLENENFSIWYIMVLVLFVSLGLFGVFRKQQFLHDLKVTTIKQARKNLEKKNKGFGVIVMPLSVTASIAFVLARVFSRNLNVGLGFILWALACIWLFMSMGFMYNYIIARKYKVADIFLKKSELGYGSISKE